MKIEKSNYQQTGWHCHVCDSHTKTYNGIRPDECPNCRALGTLKMEWNQSVNLTSIVTPLPLEER